MMTDFLLWYDKKPLAAIAAAVKRYQEKFNQPANLVLVNQAQFDPALTVPGLEIQPARYVQRNHLQVGRVDKQMRLV